MMPQTQVGMTRSHAVRILVLLALSGIFSRICPERCVSGDDTARPSTQSTVYTQCYYVEDLVLPVGSPQFSLTGERAPAESPKPDFETLTELIEKSVYPESWEANGGVGTMEAFPSNLSLVVSATQEVQEAIAEMLQQLRKLQDNQVKVTTQVLEVSPPLLDRLGIGGKSLAVLNGEEFRSLLAEVRRDPRARQYKGDKAIFFSGQTVSYANSDKVTDTKSATYRVQGIAENNRVTLALYDGSTIVAKPIATTVSSEEAILIVTTPETQTELTPNSVVKEPRLRLVVMTAANQPASEEMPEQNREEEISARRSNREE